MNIKETIEFVQKSHGDQPYGHTPFIVHPLLVARHFTNETLIKIALLHDIVEDTHITLEDIQRLYGIDIANAVDHLTHREIDTYEEYIERVSWNKLAIVVKIADLQENIYSATYNYPGEYEHELGRYYVAYSKLSACKNMYPDTI